AGAHYTDPWHKKFFGQRGALLHAIRRQDRFLCQYSDRIDYLLYRSRFTWTVQESEPLRTTILAGCDAFRDWFDRQSSSDLLMLLVDASHVADNCEEADIFLEYTLHCRLQESARDDGEFSWIPPDDLPHQLAQAHPGVLCETIELLRKLTSREEPWPPRTDYLPLLADLQKRIRSYDRSQS
ncbi:MAG: hypothetical protein ACYCOU_22170, partial [Sulfobacillus sp.]